jgi:hypothetical protein
MASGTCYLMLRNWIVEWSHLTRSNERDEKGFCTVAPECVVGRLYRLVRTIDNPQRSRYCMVSDAVHEYDTIGVHRSAEGRVEEVHATMRLWGIVRIPLDSVLLVCIFCRFRHWSASPLLQSIWRTTSNPVIRSSLPSSSSVRDAKSISPSISASALSSLVFYYRQNGIYERLSW